MTLAGRKSSCCRIGVIGEIVSWCFWHDGGDSYYLEEVVLPWQGGGNSIGNCSMAVEWNNLRRCIRCSKLWIALDQRERSKDMSYTYRFHNFSHRKTTYQKSSGLVKKWMKRTRFHNQLMPVHAPMLLRRNVLLSSSSHDLWGIFLFCVTWQE